MTFTSTTVTARDDHFGELTVRLEDRTGELAVEGKQIPGVAIRRAEGTQLESHVPIGTRDGSRLTMTVGGDAAQLVPAKGFLTRRSYRVETVCTGSAYHLVPVSIGESRLSRDGVKLGDFTATGDGDVSVDWYAGAKPTPLDAAIGYALAAAFGTGAQPMWELALEMAFGVFT